MDSESTAARERFLALRYKAFVCIHVCNSVYGYVCVWCAYEWLVNAFSGLYDDVFVRV